MKLAPSLHRIGSDHVNSYLVEDARGATIIDAGLPGHWKELQVELAAMGRSLDDVRGVVLTHGDTDHIGFAEQLRREQGVPVHVHELDAERALGREKKPNGEQGPRPAPFTLEPSMALESLAKLEDMPATRVLPGHGAPWSGGLADAVHRIREMAAKP